MREIKFRAWLENEILSHEDLVDMDQETHAIYTCITNEQQEDDVVYMQYTGLKDVNGKEIYEGDVLQFLKGQTLIVHYNENTASFGANYILHRDEYGQLIGGWIGGARLDKQTIEHEGVVIIGNAYKNPELLTELADFVLKKHYPHALGDSE